MQELDKTARQLSDILVRQLGQIRPSSVCSRTNEVGVISVPGERGVEAAVAEKTCIPQDTIHPPPSTCYVRKATLISPQKRKGEVVISMEQKVRDVRSGHSHEIVAQIISYLQAQPVGSEKRQENSNGWVCSLLELLYHVYTEFNSVEAPEFKAVIDPLDQTLRSLVDTDEEADKYMNIVFELCTAYERQSYIEGMKVGMRLMLELMEA